MDLEVQVFNYNKEIKNAFFKKRVEKSRQRIIVT